MVPEYTNDLEDEVRVCRKYIAVLENRLAKFEEEKENHVSVYVQPQLGPTIPAVDPWVAYRQPLQARNDNALRGGYWTPGGDSGDGIPIPLGYYRASTLNGHTYHPDRRKATTERRKS